MTTVRDFLNIVYDEQWVRLDFEDESHDSHIDVWGADWIGGYEGTLKEVKPYLDYEVDDMVVMEFDDPEYEASELDDPEYEGTVQMICVTVHPPLKRGKRK